MWVVLFVLWFIFAVLGWMFIAGASIASEDNSETSYRWRNEIPDDSRDTK